MALNLSSETNGIKAKKKTDYTSYLLLGIVAYIFSFILLLHTYAYLAYNPTLSFGSAISKAIDALGTHPFQIVAYPGADFFSTVFILTILFLLGGMYLWLSMEQKSRLMLRGLHGTMRFNSNMKEYNKRYTDPPKSENNDGVKNIILTDSVYLSMDTRQTRRNLNVLIIGGSGTGKSRFYFKPNLCQMPINCNYIITDPSGEILADVGTMLEESGFKIKCFNLVNMKKSDTYNPLEYIKTENDVILLADCILANTSDPNKKGGDDFWEKAMKLMLQAFIFLLWLHGDELGLEKNLDSVMMLLDGCIVDDEDDESTDSFELTPTDKYFAMIQYGYTIGANGEPILGTRNHEYDNKHGMDIAIKQYRKFKSSGKGKTFQNMLISAAARFSTFDAPELVNLTSSNSIDLESIPNEKTALFVTLPQEHDSFNFLAALMYSQLFQVLYYHAENNCQGNYIVRDELGEIVRIYEINHEVLEDDATPESLFDDDAIEEEISLTPEKTKMSAKEKLKDKQNNKLKFKKQREEQNKKIASIQKEADKMEGIEQFDSVDDMNMHLSQLQKAANVNEAALRVDTTPGKTDDADVEKLANQLVEDLKNVKLVKKGEKFIIRCFLTETQEETMLGVYGNEEYAISRARALKNCHVTRCGLHLPYHVRCLLDEFANIGQIPNFTKLLATMRKYEISCTIALQNLAQIKNMYEKDWGSIVGNCDSILLLGSSELDTQEYFSKKLGKTTVESRSVSTSKGGKSSTSSSTQQAARELMLPEEIGQMDEDECILIIRGIYPFRGLKFRYEKHKNFKMTADYDKSNLYRFRLNKAVRNELSPVFFYNTPVIEKENNNDATVPNTKQDTKGVDDSLIDSFIKANSEPVIERISNKNNTVTPHAYNDVNPSGIETRAATKEDIISLLSRNIAIIDDGDLLDDFDEFFDETILDATVVQKEEPKSINTMNSEPQHEEPVKATSEVSALHNVQTNASASDDPFEDDDSDESVPFSPNIDEFNGDITEADTDESIFTL